MRTFNLFEFFRFMLTVLVTTYTIIRLVTFIWRWQGAVGGAHGGNAVFYRYLGVLLLRTRLRRFLYELVTLGGLIAVLALLILFHWR